MSKSPTSLASRIEALDWNEINAELLANGFSLIPSLLSGDECDELKSGYANDLLYRSTIDMKRYNFGKGEYRYFKYPLPSLVQTLRTGIYAELVPAAKAWSERLRKGIDYPNEFSAFQETMRENGQTRPTPLVLRYGKGDFNCLHQDINNDIVFPYQVVLGLSEAGRDYEGGQLVLTQQRPRMQTVPHVITIPKGGAVLFTSNFHPQQGARGYFRSVFRHGVGKITEGERFTLGIVFHDYREKE